MNRFLRNPALFPARIAGEPWGKESVTIELPTGPFRIHGISEVQAASLCDRFRSPADPSDSYDIQVFRAPESDFIHNETPGSVYEFDINGPEIVGYDLMARIGPDRGAIWTFVTEREYFWSVVENVLRPLVARRLVATGGLLVHSSCVVIDGRAFLFCGASGAGKSTIAGLAVEAGKEVFSDDLNAIEDGQVVPLPFSGTFRPPKVRGTPAPLHAIMGLEKGSGEAIRAISPSRAMSLLVSCAPFINRDHSFGDALLDRASELAMRVRAGILTFRREGNVWPILEKW